MIRMLPDAPEQSADVAGRYRLAGIPAGRSPGPLHGASSHVPDIVAGDAIAATMCGLLPNPSGRVSSSGPRQSASREPCGNHELSPHQPGRGPAIEKLGSRRLSFSAKIGHLR